MAAILLLSSPVAEQYLTVEDGPLSPPGFRQQSSVAEHFSCRFVSNPAVKQSLSVEDGPLSPPAVPQQSSVVVVEDGFVSLPSILSQSSVHEQLQLAELQSVDAGHC